MPEKELQQGELFGQQIDLLTVPCYLVAARVQRDIPYRQHSAGENSRSPEQSAHARRQLSHLERLGQIIVRSRVESGLLLVDRATLRQHQHRRLAALRSKTFEDLDASHARQLPVQDDRVIAETLEHLHAGASGVRNLDVVVLAGKIVPHQTRQQAIVFHHQYLGHCLPPAVDKIIVLRPPGAPGAFACRRQGRCRPHGVWEPLSDCSGIRNQKVLPFPSSLSTPIVPPWSSTIALQMASPNPLPFFSVASEARTCLNLSKTLSR